MQAAYFEPYSAGFMNDPWPVYARLRDEHPILAHDELGLTLFSRYADILALLRDARLGRAPLDDTSLAPAQTPHYRRYVSRNLLEREGQTHSRLRCVFAQLLTPALIQSLTPSITEKCEQLVSGALSRSSSPSDQPVSDALPESTSPSDQPVSDGSPGATSSSNHPVPDALRRSLSPPGQHAEIDFLEKIAVPLTVHVIAELMGWPAEQRHFLRPWSADIVKLYEKDCDEAAVIAAEAATEAFADSLQKLVAQRARHPGADLISQLAEFEIEGQISRDELISSCMLLLNAGHEATVNGAGNGLLALLSHPDQLALLRDQPGLMPGAIEEMLRFDPPLHLFHRFVNEDMEFGGVQLRRGDKVGLLYGSANRDPSAFQNPDKFDIRRRPNRHLAFGAETHFCMGAPLARLELSILLKTLLARSPAIRLADTHPRYRPGFVFRGLEQLPIIV